MGIIRKLGLEIRAAVLRDQTDTGQGLPTSTYRQGALDAGGAICSIRPSRLLRTNGAPRTRCLRGAVEAGSLWMTEGYRNRKGGCRA